jgi:hypothetical protein
VGEACGVALRVGVGARVGAAADDGDPAAVAAALALALALAVTADDDDVAGWPAHPASTAPPRSMASGTCHDNLMRHHVVFASASRV